MAIERSWARQLGLSPALLLIVVNLLFYGRGLTAYLASDDFNLIHEYEPWWYTPGSTGPFRPLWIFMLKGVYALFGANALIYHSLSLFLHLLTTLLVFQLFHRLTGDRALSLLASLLFSTFPRHHQAVVWTSGSNELLAVLFSLLTLLWRVQARETGLRRYQAASVGAFALALLSLESAAALLGLLLLLEVLLLAPGQERGWRQLAGWVRAYAPYALVLGLYLLLVFGGEGLVKLKAEGEGYRFLGLKASLAAGWVRYVLYTLVPFLQTTWLGRDLLSLSLYGVAVGASVILWVRGSGWVRYWTAWVWGSTLPFALFGVFGPADRYFYLPAVGFAALAAQAVAWAWGRRRWKAVALVGLGLYGIAAFGVVQWYISGWQAAGATTRRILEEVQALYPRFPSHSTLYFVGLPHNNGRTAVFSNGIGGAIRIWYEDRTLSVVHSFDGKLAGDLVKGDSGDSFQGKYIFAYYQGHIRDVSSKRTELEKRLPIGGWHGPH